MQALTDPLRAARAAVRTGRFQDAAVTLAELPPEVRQGAEWYLLSAMVSWRLGDFAAGRREALAAQRLYRARGDADGEMRAVNVAAAGAFGLGALNEAEEGFHRAQELARALRDDLMLARCSNNLGNVALYLAQLDAALGFYRIARAGFERLGFHHGVAETWVNAAISWRDIGRHSEALNAADQALEFAERADAARLIGEALANRGAALAALGEIPLGRVQVERALVLVRAEQDRFAEADVLRILGTIALADHSTVAALRWGREALALATTLRHPWTIAEVQRDLARTYRAIGAEREARAAFDAAAESFVALGSVPRAETMRQEREGTS
jgi:tetratricopeptide (TPR) repeat protein